MWKPRSIAAFLTKLVISGKTWKTRKFVTSGSSNGQKRSASTSLTGERPVLEMTRLFWPVLDRSAWVVNEKRCPYWKSLQKVFPRWCLKHVLIRTVSSCLTGERPDLWPFLLKSVFSTNLLHFRNQRYLAHTKNTENTEKQRKWCFNTWPKCRKH